MPATLNFPPVAGDDVLLDDDGAILVDDDGATLTEV
jgi:hypothetical protein